MSRRQCSREVREMLDRAKRQARNTQEWAIAEARQEGTAEARAAIARVLAEAPKHGVPLGDALQLEALLGVDGAIRAMREGGPCALTREVMNRDAQAHYARQKERV